MKRILALLLVLCMGVSLLAACGNNSTETTGTTQNTTEATTQQTTETTEQTIESTEALWQLTLTHDDITLVKKGETMTLYSGEVPAEQITWGSEDEKVATFENGVVTAVAKGETTVYGEYEGIRAACKVYCNIKETVTPAPQPTTGNTDSGNAGASTGGKRDPVQAAPAQQVVDSSFFDDAVFIGDSISLKLSYYAASSGELGKAKFLVVGSYGVGNAVYDGLELTYQGQSYKNVEDALAATGAKKLFIMLGMNDIARKDFGYVDGAITNWGKLLDLLKSTCPDMTVYIQSMTPVWTGGEKGGLNNKRVNEYNEKLKAFAQNNGYKFIDIAPYMKDSTGGLATRFCSDQYVHLTDEGAKTWIKVLKAFTGY